MALPIKYAASDSSPPAGPIMEGWHHRKRVVVVGGGVAGAFLAKSVQSYVDVVLIDPKEYFEIPWANLRSKVEPSVANRALISHSDYLSTGKIITSQAVHVTETEVVTTEGRRVVYDYLVIATGHRVPSPRSRRDRIEQFQEDNMKIRNSNSVLVIGGGPTGVELAGEIASDYPEKQVTLVHRGERLMKFIGQKASDKALDWLRCKKVDVLLGQSINLERISEADREFTTSAGKTVMADCYFVCVDRPLGSCWLRGTYLQEYLDKRGRLMVDENLRVGGMSNIFAIGDITDIQELKQGFLAQKHAGVVAKNLKLLTKGAKDIKLAKYLPAPVMALVSLGRRDAVAHCPWITMIGLLPGMVKSRDLFLQRTRKQMGLDGNSGYFNFPW